MNAKKINSFSQVQDKRRVVKKFILKGMSSNQIVDKTNLNRQDVDSLIGWLERNDMDVIQYNYAKGKVTEDAVVVDEFADFDDVMKAKLNSKEDRAIYYKKYIVDHNIPLSAEKYDAISDEVKHDIVKEYLRGSTTINKLVDSSPLSRNYVYAILHVYIKPNVMKEMKQRSVAPVKLLPDEVEASIVKDYNTMQYTKKDLTKKYNCSLYAVNKVINELIDEKRREQIKSSILSDIRKHHGNTAPVVADEHVVVDEPVDDKPAVVAVAPAVIDKPTIAPAAPKLKLVPLEINKVVVGLCDGRHAEIPVDKFIFDYISSSKISDFAWLEMVIERFIKDNIEFDNNGDAKAMLEVYMTGLSHAHFALARVCSKMRVNLNVLHHNKTTDKYDKQVVFDQFNIANTNVSKINSIVKQDTIMMLDSDIKDFENVETFFELNVTVKAGMRVMNKYSIIALEYASLLLYQAKLQLEYYDNNRSNILSYALILNQHNMDKMVTNQISAMNI